jgi:hypothetical protein
MCPLSHSVADHTRVLSKPHPVFAASSLWISLDVHIRAPALSQKSFASVHVKAELQLPSAGPSLSLHTRELPYRSELVHPKSSQEDAEIDTAAAVCGVGAGASAPSAADEDDATSAQHRTLVASEFAVHTSAGLSDPTATMCPLSHSVADHTRVLSNSHPVFVASSFWISSEVHIRAPASWQKSFALVQLEAELQPPSAGSSLLPHTARLPNLAALVHPKSSHDDVDVVSAAFVAGVGAGA